MANRRIRCNLHRALLATLLATGATMARAELFEELALSPRARAMGQATTATPGDAWSFSHNPAMLALLDRATLASATVEPNGQGFNRLSALGGATPLPFGRGGLAAGIRHYGVDFDGEDLLSEDTISFAHGFTLFRDAHASAQVGWGVNLYRAEFGRTILDEDLGEAWSWGLDVGVVATLHERTRAGFFTRNLNNPTIGVQGEELRQSVSIGMAYVPFDGVTTAFDIRSRLGEELRFHGGSEWLLTELLSLRAGIETDPNKMSAGFAVHLPPTFSLHYGFSTGGGVLDGSHHFGLSYDFDPPGGATP